MRKEYKSKRFILLFIKPLFSSPFVHFKEIGELFFALLLQLIISLLSFKVNAEFKGCQNCLQSIGRQH